MKHFSEKLEDCTRNELSVLFRLRDYAKIYLIPEDKRKAAFELFNSMQVALRAFCTLEGIEYHENYTIEDIVKRLHDWEESSLERD